MLNYKTDSTNMFQFAEYEKRFSKFCLESKMKSEIWMTNHHYCSCYSENIHIRSKRHNIPASIYLLKVGDKSTRATYEICSKLTTKTHQSWCRFVVHQLLTLNEIRNLFYYLYIHTVFLLRKLSLLTKNVALI